MAAHRTEFTAVEWLTLRCLAQALAGADDSDRKYLRGGMRGLGFYISDHEKLEERFRLADLDRLLDNGTLRVRD